MSSLKKRGSGGRREEDGEGGEKGSTSRDMQDFSMSSIISNLSKLVDGNNSSFLMHVESNPNSRRCSISPQDEPVVDLVRKPPVAMTSFVSQSSDQSVDNLQQQLEPILPEEQESDTNFFLEDWMKGFSAAPLPIRRFPAPPLPAIFEQSGEESLSHSRASSIASSVASMQSVKKSKMSLQGSSGSFSDKVSSLAASASLVEFMKGIADAEHGRQRIEQDSWDEFDREMDKSLLPKEYELQEFEKLAARSHNGTVLQEEDKSFFGNPENILDRDEKERDQFCRSVNNTFSEQISVGAGEGSFSGNGDILSITNYFKSRSSFPVENIANESSRFLDESVVILNPPEEQHPVDPTEDLKITRNYSSVFRDDNTVTPTTPCRDSPSSITTNNDVSVSNTPAVIKSFSLDNKTKKLANFLIGPESNGAGRSTIMDYVLDVCKRRSSIGTSAAGLNNYREQFVTPLKISYLPSVSHDKARKQLDSERAQNASTPIKKNKKEAEDLKKFEISKSKSNLLDQAASKSSLSLKDYHANNKSGRVHYHKLPYPSEHKPKSDEQKAEQFKIPPAPKPLAAKSSSDKVPSFGGHDQDKLSRPRTAPKPAPSRPADAKLYAKVGHHAFHEEQGIEDKSILVSEPGKVFHDDLDTTADGFDKFKSNLHKPKNPERLRGKSNVSKENKPPVSAFTTPPVSILNTTVILGTSDENRNTSVENSIERLRTASVNLSPPERPYDSTSSTESRATVKERNMSLKIKTPPAKNLELRLGTNHSTPVAQEPTSRILQKQPTLITGSRKGQSMEEPKSVQFEESTPMRTGESNLRTKEGSDPMKKDEFNPTKKDEFNPTKEEESDAAKKEQFNPTDCNKKGQFNPTTDCKKEECNSVPSSTYSYTGMMPPPAGYCHPPAQYPVSIHIHLPSFAMGFPQNQFALQPGAESFLPMGASATANANSTPNFNPSCLNHCKCPHQNNGRTN